ncbi:type IV secretory system conjugative DNA transfer family protein [Phytomonospora sp. NPDC050363]|uniref:type IV secretory system conjugative DNA transfer family protein n=1 Tax=Phytomonospora sp. NPDC050363 TaxID=3155642 RepID=UPI0033F2D1AF
MSGALRPRVGGFSGPTGAYILIGAAWGLICAGWLTWSAGRVAAWITGAEPGLEFGAAFAVRVVQGEFALAFGGTPLWLVAVLSVLFIAAPASGILIGVRLWRGSGTEPGDPLVSLASVDEVKALTAAKQAPNAKRLRDDLHDIDIGDLTDRDTGLALGDMMLPRGRKGPLLVSSWEDCVLAFMGPRSGKTVALASPHILDAPGAVIATSNRADIWATTHAARAQRGAVWAFDPQGLLYQEQTFWVDLLAGVESFEEAARLATHFTTRLRAGGKGGSDFWLDAAEELLCGLILAAAYKDGGTMRDVQAWLADSSDTAPVRLLRDNKYPEAARALTKAQNGAVETRDGIYQTAATAARCLQDPKLLVWITPSSQDPKLRRLLPSHLALSATSKQADTLYILAKDGAGSAAPLAAALLDQALRAAVRVSEANGGRMPIPFVVIADEAANGAPLIELPAWLSHFGGRLIQLVIILQNIAQGTPVWGEQGMATMWAAATVKLVGAGTDDTKFAGDVSTLIGDHDVPVESISRDAQGYRSVSVSLRRQRILATEDIRAMAKQTAVVFASGTRPTMVSMRPWFKGPDAEQLTEDVLEAIDAIADKASLDALFAEAPFLADRKRRKEAAAKAKGAALMPVETPATPKPVVPRFVDRRAP